MYELYLVHLEVIKLVGARTFFNGMVNLKCVLAIPLVHSLVEMSSVGIRCAVGLCRVALERQLCETCKSP